MKTIRTWWFSTEKTSCLNGSCFTQPAASAWTTVILSNFYKIFPLHFSLLQHCIVVKELAHLMPRLGLISYHSCFNTFSNCKNLGRIPSSSNFMRFSASDLYALPISFRLEHEGEVSDSDVSIWHKTQSSQFVAARAEFSDDDDAEISTTLNFNMAMDSKLSQLSHACFSLLISQLCRFWPAQSKCRTSFSLLIS